MTYVLGVQRTTKQNTDRVHHMVENIDRPHHMVMDDKQPTINQIVNGTSISCENVENILHNVIGMTKFSAR